ncbi:hypothetical protein KGF42_13125 [Clostridioides sp. ZZV15-6383]|uniref:hypothetical protein n=1 Tax=Clostridioides sp. ZZV15-6383 TaxID=2811498 RepID=UPI001D1082CC|nr:hypothetical protein [Clostridioides sp. ZZV15-6383]
MNGQEVSEKIDFKKGVKSILKEIFVSLNMKYLIKSYIISAVLTLIFLSSNIPSVGMFIIIMANAILFPFSALVYDDLFSLMMGNTLFIMPIVFIFLWKLIKVILLYTFAIFIAPLGIAYILIRNRVVK